MFNKLFNRAKPLGPELLPADRTFDKAVARVYGLRRGMWVTAGEHGTGILTNIYDSGNVLVMLVNSDGSNRVVLPCHAMELKQARYKDIPESRRPERLEAIKYGYW